MDGGSKSSKKRAGLFGRLMKRIGTGDKLTALLAVIVIAASLVTFVPAMGASGTEVDSNIGGTELSISRFSEIVGQAFNSTMAQALPNPNAAAIYVDKVDQLGEVNLATIGNFLGYNGGDANGEDFSNIWTKGTDAASRVMTLETAAGFYGGEMSTLQTKLPESNICKYIIWGSALNAMGIDEFRDAQSASDGIRMIAGYAAYIFFILAYSASNIMKTVIDLMDKFNIFKMFWEAGFQGLKALVGVNAPLLQKVEAAYTVIHSARLIIMAIAFVGLIFSTYVYKSRAYNNAGTVQERWRRFFYRFAVVAIGVPVVGMVYTEMIDLIGAQAASTQYNITNYVFQEFLDFEGWTTKAGQYSFKVAGSVAEMKNFSVVYDSSSQNISIGKLNGEEISEPLDVSKFVYSINETLYKTAVTGSAADAVYVDTLYGTSGVGSGTADYQNLLSTTPSSNPKEAYQKCRDLLLNYARSNTVMPDTLNDIYLRDIITMSNSLIDATAAGDANQAAAANATAIEQLFGVNAANQRIWSYIKTDDPNWIYPKDKDPRTMILAEADGQQIEAVIDGIAGVSGHGTENKVSVNGATIMAGTLNPSWRAGSGTVYAGSNAIKTTNGSVKVSSAINGVSNYKFIYTFDLSQGGMSPLALYNYMHTKFENGSMTVYSPDNTTNAGVGMMHYAVTTPYSGIPELVQLLFVICILFNVGIIGWVFGISLLMNTVVQTVKAIPVIFKMMLGSIQGFVEGLLIALSIAAELLVTVLLYAWSIDIIDFLIKVVQRVVLEILKMFKDVSGGAATIDSESYAIMSGIISMVVILWGTFNLIKWRRAITISIKSLLTHVLNQVFGTSAAMPTGASSGMLKAGAGLAAGAMIAGSLADQGTLDDVVNDLTDSDLGSSIHDKLAEGDYEGAMQDISDYASGNYTGSGDRGRSETSEAERALAEADERVGGALSASGQSLTDEQKEELDDEFGADIQAADEKLRDAEQNGTEEEQAEAREELNDALTARAEKAAGMRRENARKAEQLGVADYGDYLRNQKEGIGTEAAGIDGADLPDKPQRDGEDAELDANAQMAYDAANDGDAQTLRTASQMYDERGLTAAQKAEVDDMVLDGASEQEVADKIDDFARENFGDDYDKVVDKINEASGRSNTATYGDNNPTDARQARTMSVQGIEGEDGGIQYGMTDNNNGEQVLMDMTSGEAQEVKGGTFLPEDPGVELDSTSAGIYRSVAQGDHAGMLAAAGTVSALGTFAHQDRILSQMAANGASATEIAAAANNFAQDNFGDNYAQVVSQINQAAGRTSERVTLSGTGADGQSRSVDIQMDSSSSGQVSYKVHGSDGGGSQTIEVQEGGSGGNVNYVNRGSQERVVTQDFGKTDGMTGGTYGETYGRMLNVANASGGMIQVGAPGGVSGGSPGVVTTSEMTAAAMAQQAMNVSGQATSEVRMGNVSGAGGVQQHMGTFQQVMETHEDAMEDGSWNSFAGSAGQAEMIRRTEQTIHHTVEGAGDGGSSDGGAGTAGGDEFFDPTSEDSGVIFDPDEYQGGGNVQGEGRNGGE